MSFDREVAAGPADFRLIAHVLASAIEEAGPGGVKQAVANASRRLGEVVGHDVRSNAERTRGFEAQMAAIGGVLRSYGFEPQREGEEVRLLRCPFHALAQDHMVLVCGANLAFLDGLVAALEAVDVEVRLDPVPGRCCVVLGPLGGHPEYGGG